MYKPLNWKKYMPKYKNGGLFFKNRNHEFGLNMEFWGMENMMRNSGGKKGKEMQQLHAKIHI